MPAAPARELLEAALAAQRTLEQPPHRPASPGHAPTNQPATADAPPPGQPSTPAD